MKTPVGRLSGGERRMVSIGRGLMTDAKLYLADEPSLGLAPKIGMGVMEALLAIDLKDSAMLIAEQNVALLEGAVDRVIGMHAGKLKGEASSSFRLAGATGEDWARWILRFILVNAITRRRIYGLIAIAVSITWSSLGLINLAYGFIFAFAGYARLAAPAQLSRPQSASWSLAAGILAGAIGGIIVCLIVFIPLHDKPAFTSRGMIATLAISLDRQPVASHAVRPDAPSRCPNSSARWRVKFFGITLTADKIGIVVCSIADAGHRRAVDALEPARPRDPRHDDEPACRLDRRHRHPAHRPLCHGAHRRDGRAGRGAALPDLLHRALLRPHAPDQGRVDRAVRRARQRCRAR